jgi:hypothetical protein
VTISVAAFLLLLAVVCFLLAAIGVPAGRISLLALGLFFAALVWFLQTAGVHVT